jgi:hypothetical protein
MSDKSVKVMTIDTIDRQRKYVASQKEKGHGLGIVFADAFLRGMRDLGYKNPAWALAEQVDNAFQAAADFVAMRFGFDSGNKSQAKPDVIALLDNGNGMIPEMISYAVRWGGTDREGDRNGFGRYGYGLPSSAVSLAKRYTVYSKANGAEWYAVTVDIEELAAAAGDVHKTEDLLTAKPSNLPTWINKAAKGDDKIDIAGLKSGTVIVFEDLDRLRRLSGWIKTDSLRTKLLQHFGVIYRHWIPERRIIVDGMDAQAVDPLFLMEHARFCEETQVRAQRVEARTIEVETSRGTTGTVSIRASLLPPHFQLVDPSQYGIKGAKNNKRHEIMKDYNGLLICRERRQIDCIPPRWTKFQNYDANVKVEIDFDPELDEFFGITTAKQQIVIDDDMWEKLQHKGKNGGALMDLVEDLRNRFDTIQKSLKAKNENRISEESRASVVAMEQSEKFKGTVLESTPAQIEEAKNNLEQAASERADVTGKPKEEVLKALIEETTHRRWELEFSAIPEGPFYRPVRLGEQKRLVINTDHPFYTKIYDVAPEVRAALEVLLFVLAERELEVKREAETFYKAERQRWSERLRHALDTLVREDTMVNKAAFVAERMHMAMEADAVAGGD